MLLADAVVLQPNGVLTIIGAGWMVRPPGVQAGTSAVAVFITVPRDELGDHQIRLELLDSEDEIVVVEPPEGPGPLVFERDFRAQGLDDPRVTIPVTVSLGINCPPFALPRSSEYRWRVYVDGVTHESWSLPFRTSPPAPPRQTG